MLKPTESAVRLLKAVNPNAGALQAGALRMLGDSMSPTLEEGDIVLVDLSMRGYRVPGLYVVRIDDSPHVKRVQRWQGKWRVWTDNPAYQAFTVPDGDPDFEIIAEVRAMIVCVS